MGLSFRLPEDDCGRLILLAAAYAIIRLPLLFVMPLMQDEAVYAVMFEEQRAHPALLPTFLGHAVSWKPPLFFWSTALLSQVPLPMEAAYRWPTFIYGLIAIVPLYFLLRNSGASRNVASATVAIFLLSLPTAYADTVALTDSLFFLFMASALYLYTEARLGQNRFIAAGVLSFLAFFTKQLVPLAIPALAAAYFLTRKGGKETLRNPVFLLSLAATPAAFVLHALLLQSVALAQELYVSELLTHIGGMGAFNPLEMVIGSAQTLLLGAGLWVILAVLGLWKHWRSELFMAFWLALSVVPLFSAYYMAWHYLPVMPAIAYFAALALLRWEGKEKADAFFAMFFAAVCVFSLASIVFTYNILYSPYVAQKEAGLLLAGKENVLIIGAYQPGIIAYKAATEMRAGRQLDFGWILLQENSGDEVAQEFIRDYRTGRYGAVDGSFSAIFSDTTSIFRKDTDLTRFDYVCVVERNAGPPGAEIIYNESGVTIYKTG